MPTISLSFFTRSELASIEGDPCYSLAQKRGLDLLVKKLDSDFTTITTNGSYDQLLEFFYVMKDIIIYEKPADSDLSRDLMNKFVLRFSVPSTVIRALVGKGGQAIDTLRKLSLASIVIQFAEKEDGDSIIELEGSVSAISETFPMVLMRLLCLRPGILLPGSEGEEISATKKFNRELLSSSDMFSEHLFFALNPTMSIGEYREILEKEPSGKDSVHDCSFSFIIPNKSAGSIIGPSGSLINQIRASTQTSIKITKAGKGIHQRCVTVNGEGNNVLQAGKLLMEHLEQSE